VIIEIEASRLIVISDLHLGNPASTASLRIVEFLRHVAEVGATLCINGDGFDMLQTSFTRLVNDAAPMMSRLREIRNITGPVHYVVGNHDIVLEHFLDDIHSVQLSPFLNVHSGDARIRVEHGHVYDPFFARSPELYEWATKAAGLALAMRADVYHVWTIAQQRLGDRRRARASAAGDPTLASHGHAAAEMLLQRGFDAVVFGHTHHAETAQLASGLYVNSGDWMRDSTYVDIHDGVVRLERWRSTDTPRRRGRAPERATSGPEARPPGEGPC
jgi:UDP-2,3-diacylglucosamine pyrophosphatase LpxH